MLGIKEVSFSHRRGALCPEDNIFFHQVEKLKSDDVWEQNRSICIYQKEKLLRIALESLKRIRGLLKIELFLTLVSRVAKSCSSFHPENQRQL